MTPPPVPEATARAWSRHTTEVQARLLDIRAMIFAVAAETDGVGPLTETLKWGEPAWLTAASGSGTTIRLGVPRLAPDHCAVFFNCRTTLVETFRQQVADSFSFQGNRALIIAPDAPLPEGPLALCLRAALTYHRRAACRLAP